MPTSPVLQGKHAVVFGGGGSVGGAVASELASEGAEVFLAGRTSMSVEVVAKEIAVAGRRSPSERVHGRGEHRLAVAVRRGRGSIELGPAGVRAVCLRTGANLDSRTIEDTADVIATAMNVTNEQAMATFVAGTMLDVSPCTVDTAKAAAFLASDAARMITAPF